MDQQPASTYSLDFLQQDCPAELPSWSFNENVLDDFREFIDGVQMSEAGQSDPLTSELERPSTSTTQDAVNEPSTSRTRPPRQLSKSHRQRQNQQAQQRYRQRQRGRTETLEAEVAAAEAQLHELKGRQRQLEARNQVLATVGSLRLFDEPGRSLGTGVWSNLAPASGGAKETITLTVLGKSLEKTVQDVAAMPFTEFATLYAAYAQKIKHCLAQISHNENDTAAAQEVRMWTCQCNSMRMFLAVGDLSKFAAFSSSRLDGVMGPGAKELTDSWYQAFLAALELTEAQQVDMMYLRMLFYAKLGALSRQRKELLRQASHRAEEVPTEDMDAVQAASRLAATGALAQQLHDNSAAEFKTYMQLTSAYRRGILTYMQQATCITMAFPYIADEPRILEVLAAQRNETPLSMLTQPAGLDDFELDSSWLQVASYLSSVTQDKLDEHVPLMSNHLVALFQMSRGDAVPSHETTAAT
ncbi:TPA: hypothetical protein ACH3X2_004799 [Trebouxia sp. C0005]